MVSSKDRRPAYFPASGWIIPESLEQVDERRDGSVTRRRLP
jgi:hypothetical protein